MNKGLLKTIETQKVLALEKKKQLKRKHTAKTFTVLEKCKKHGGPVTTDSLQLLQMLNMEELLSEVSYLRYTVAPNIRQMRRERAETGKFKMVKFTKEQLITQIKNAIAPEEEGGYDIEDLLKNTLKK